MKLFSFLAVYIHCDAADNHFLNKEEHFCQYDQLYNFLNITLISLVETFIGAIFQSCFLRALRTNIFVYYSNLAAQYHIHLTVQRVLQHVSTRICHLQRVNLPSFKPATIDKVIL
jgi:hypothetical protein